MSLEGASYSINDLSEGLRELISSERGEDSFADLLKNKRKQFELGNMNPFLKQVMVSEGVISSMKEPDSKVFFWFNEQLNQRFHDFDFQAMIVKKFILPVSMEQLLLVLSRAIFSLMDLAISYGVKQVDQSINWEIKNLILQFIPGKVRIDQKITSDLIDIAKIEEYKKLFDPKALQGFESQYKYKKNSREGKIHAIEVKRRLASDLITKQFINSLIKLRKQLLPYPMKKGFI
jgi:hypothetical protein